MHGKGYIRLARLANQMQWHSNFNMNRVYIPKTIWNIIYIIVITKMSTKSQTAFYRYNIIILSSVNQSNILDSYLSSSLTTWQASSFNARLPCPGRTAPHLTHNTKPSLAQCVHRWWHQEMCCQSPHRVRDFKPSPWVAGWELYTSKGSSHL